MEVGRAFVWGGMRGGWGVYMLKRGGGRSEATRCGNVHVDGR